MDFLRDYQTTIFNYGAFLVNAFVIVWNVIQTLPDNTLILGGLGLLTAQVTGLSGIKANKDIQTAKVDSTERIEGAKS